MILSQQLGAAAVAVLSLLCSTVVVGAGEKEDDGWGTDLQLEAAVASAGFGGCSIARWGEEHRGQRTHPQLAGLTQPMVIPAAYAPDWARDASKQWSSRPAFARLYGNETVTIRLPAGQRQSGLLVRPGTVEELIVDGSNSFEVGVERGLLLSRAPASIVRATHGMPPPDVLARANLNASVLSLGGIGSGLPFHNHGAAWLTVLVGKKLIVVSPPRGQGVPNVRFQALQHRPPVSWSTAQSQQVASLFRGAGVKHQHCILGAGDTVFVPCNYYHATLNLGQSLALGGQQPFIGGHASSVVKCPADMDAQANTAFGAATESIRQALERPDGKGGSSIEGKIRSLAMGEALLQHSLSVAPLRIDLWLWRLRIALARRDSTMATELATQAAAQYQGAVDGHWMPALRAISSLVAIADSLPVSSAAEQLLLRTAFHVGATAGRAALDHPHWYRLHTGSANIEPSGKSRSISVRQELTERLKAHVARTEL
jgi:hypothetical protein